MQNYLFTLQAAFGWRLREWARDFGRVGLESGVSDGERWIRKERKRSRDWGLLQTEKMSDCGGAASQEVEQQELIRKMTIKKLFNVSKREEEMSLTDSQNDRNKRRWGKSTLYSCLKGNFVAWGHRANIPQHNVCVQKLQRKAQDVIFSCSHVYITMQCLPWDYLWQQGCCEHKP